MTGLTNPTTALSKARIACIRRLTKKKPMTAAEITASIAAPRSTVHDLLHFLEGKAAHIGSWRRDPTQLVAQWVWGAGANAPKPEWVLPAPAVPKRDYSFRRQPVYRDRSVAMLFGEAR